MFVETQPGANFSPSADAGIRSLPVTVFVYSEPQAWKGVCHLDRSGLVTIEDIVREEMRPILRTWVDDHLPKMLERLLQEELEKIAKRAMDD